MQLLEGYHCPLVLFSLFILERVLQITVAVARHTGPALSLYRGKCSEEKSLELGMGGEEESS